MTGERRKEMMKLNGVSFREVFCSSLEESWSRGTLGGEAGTLIWNPGLWGFKA